jgi:hypothetical protein
MAYRLRIDGDDGLSVDRLVGKELVLRMLQLEEWAVGISSTPKPGDVVADSDAKRVESSDPRSFLLESGAATNMEKIATLGVFLSRGGKSLFGPTELRDLLIRCGERPPANLGRDFKETERLRWIARDAKERGQWFVTNDARRAFESGFSSDPRPLPARGKKVTKVGSTSNTTRVVRSKGLVDQRAKPTDEQPAGIGKGVSATGPMAVVDRMCAESFFGQWRSTADVIEEAARRGFTLTRTDTTSLLPKYVRKKKLSRAKRSRDGGRPVWHYAYPGNEDSASS